MNDPTNPASPPTISLSDPPTVKADSQLFSVRIWPGKASKMSNGWRGKVQCVPTGAWRYFQNWEALVAFLQEQMTDGEG